MEALLLFSLLFKGDDEVLTGGPPGSGDVNMGLDKRVTFSIAEMAMSHAAYSTKNIYAGKQGARVVA